MCRRASVLAALVCVLVMVLMASPRAALGQALNCANQTATPDCPCMGCSSPPCTGCAPTSGCNPIPAIGCVNPNVPNSLFIAGAPLTDAPGSADALEAGRRLQCAVRHALLTPIPRIFVCGQYTIAAPDQSGTDVAAFLKVNNVTLEIFGLTSDPNEAIIQVAAGAPAFRFFFVENGGRLILTDLTLMGGRANTVTNSSGGAIFVERGTEGVPSSLEATDCVFADNFARADGGAIRFEDGNHGTSGFPEARARLILERCKFVSNSADAKGGGVATSDIMVATDCEFTSNFAGQGADPQGSGGGLWASTRTIDSPVEVFVLSSGDLPTGAKFTGNLAGEGGAIYLSSVVNCELETVTFTGNKSHTLAADDSLVGGGAVRAFLCGDLSITDCTFDESSGSNNYSATDGGALLCEESPTRIINSRFEGNVAARNGGTARMTGTQSSLLRQCVVLGGTADSGGGVFVDDNADVAFDDCVFVGNTATGVGLRKGGGALYLGGGRPFLYNCVLRGNSASLGAGVFNNGAGSAILHCTVVDIAGSGRAIQFGPKASDPVLVQNCVVGDDWTLAALDRAFDTTLPAWVVVNHSDVEMANIMAFNAQIGFHNGVMVPFTANINCDPLFDRLLDPEEVHLSECSPCIDRASEERSGGLFMTPPSEWAPLVNKFFLVDETGVPLSLLCGTVLGRCHGDFDDFTLPGANPDDLDNDELNDVDSNPIIVGTVAEDQTYPGRAQTFRPLACESDMGADEFERTEDDTLSLYCDPQGDMQDLTEITSATACEPLGQGTGECDDPEQPEIGCGPFCEGDVLCLTGVYDGLCEAGVTYQWYFRDCPTNDPALCGPLTTEFVPLANDGRITGVTTPNLCFSELLVCDSGCYRLRVSQPFCNGLPVQFYCEELGLRGDAGPLAACEDYLEVEVCIDVDQSPIIKPISPADVCVTGTQELCGLVNVPEGCELVCSWYRVVGTPDDPDAAVFPVDDVLINCAAPPVGVQCIDRAGPIPTQRECCLRFTNAAEAHEGCYYLRATCGGAECDYFSEPACLTVYRQPIITVQPVARTVCLNGTQMMCITVNSPDGRDVEVTWFRQNTCIEPTTRVQVCENMCMDMVAGVPTQICCTIPFPAAAGNYIMQAEVRICDPDDVGKCRIVLSECATLTVIDPMPVISNRAVCVGGTQTISISPMLPAPPANYSYYYKWFYKGMSPCLTAPCMPGLPCSGGVQVFNGTRPGGTTVAGAGTVTTSGLPTLTLGNVQAAEGGCWYVVVGLNSPDGGGAEDLGKCAKASNCACLTVVNPMPVVVARTVCVGGDQCLTVDPALFPILPAGYFYTYRWSFVGPSNCPTVSCAGGMCVGGSPLPTDAESPDDAYSGVETVELCITDAQITHRGCYYVVIGLDSPDEGGAPDPGKCSKNSNCACLGVIPQPTITADPEDAAVCEGGRQQLTATVTYTGNIADLCFQWYRRTLPCPADVTAADGTAVTNGSGISGATTATLTFDPAAPGHEGYYFLCVRVCMVGGVPITEEKCPSQYSNCARLDVRPPLEPCVLECASNLSDSSGNCLFCDGVAVVLCCDVEDAEGILCYQWEYCATPGPDACFMPISAPTATAQCYEFIFDADAIGVPGGPGCYRVKINYADLSEAECDDIGDKCDPVYSLPLCIAETEMCCPLECECKDNLGPEQEFYSLWQTGGWDGVNGEWSFDRTATDGLIIKAADDIFLDESSMHHIERFLGEMLVRRENPLIEPMARLRFYSDCNGSPDELLAEFDHEPCPAFLGATPEGYNRYQFWFDLRDECFWLRGGIYWVSLVGIGPAGDAAYEAVWATAGAPGNPNFPGNPPPETPDGYILGKRPQLMNGSDPWEEYDPCCHPCDDFVFCLSGETCPIMWDNGKPFLDGADAREPEPGPYNVFGTRSEKSTLTARNSRAADQFVVKTCDTEEVCYLEGYIFTNCAGFNVYLEIYENDCREPVFTLPANSPIFYPPSGEANRPVPTVVDLGITGLRVGTTNVRAYKVYFCDWPTPLIFQPGRNYWVSLMVRDTFSSAERAFFAHVKPPCEPCDDPPYWKIEPGKEIAPGRQIPDWRSANADFAFLIATVKQPDASPAGEPPPPPAVCVADLNGNEAADVQDIFMFLSAYFAGCP